MTSTPEPEQVSIPALLRAARGAYGLAIRARFAQGGFDDIPANGPFVLGGMANHGLSAGDLVRHLGISKQATSQLIDTLVIRGYLSREPSTEDRRRMTIGLTERGRAAAAAVGAGIAGVDEQLAQLCSAAEIDGLRAGLEALCEICERMEALS